MGPNIDDRTALMDKSHFNNKINTLLIEVKVKVKKKVELPK